MTESRLCTAPENMGRAGPEAVILFRDMIAAAALPPPQSAALSTLLHCYEASLFRVLDFHDFMDLQSHHICSTRTLALLSSLRPFLPAAQLAALVEAIEASDRRCVVAGPDQAPPRPSHQPWATRLSQAVARLPHRSGSATVALHGQTRS